MVDAIYISIYNDSMRAIVFPASKMAENYFVCKIDDWDTAQRMLRMLNPKHVSVRLRK